jgi:uncharacterized protein
MTMIRLALGGFALAALTISHAAAVEPVQKEPHTIVMSGEGTASGAADLARVSASTETHGRNAAAAMDANRAMMNQVFDALTALGVPKQAIQTSDFSLQPEYPPVDPKDPKPREIDGYQVTNSIEVTLDDVSKAGAVLDALIAAGANRSAGVSFGVKDPHPLAIQARANAGRDALERAQIYAKAVGATLGPVLSIRENESAVYSDSAVESVVVTASRRPTSLAPSQQSVSAQVTVIWALK